MTDKKAKRRLYDFDFSGETAHIAVVHKLQGGAANGYTTLLLKSCSDVSDELLEKAAHVQVELSFEDFLMKFFNMYYEDAEVLARLLGYEESMEDMMDHYQPMSHKAYIDQKLEGITLLKSLDEGETTISDLSAEDVVKVLQAQEDFEKATKTMMGKKYGVKDFAYTPDSEKSSSWKLNISDATHTRAAVAALGKGFRGQKVDIPADDLTAVKRKVRAAYKKFFPENEMPAILKSVEEEVDLEQIEKAVADAVEPMKVELQKAKDDLEQALELVKAYEKKDKDNKKKIRKDALSSLVSEEEIESLMKSLDSLDDEAFDVVVKSLEKKAKAEEQNDLFKEKGAGSEGDAEQMDATASILKQKYSTKN